MSKGFYVYGDVHNHIDSAQRFLEHERPNRVIWLGDFNDSLGDSPEHSRKTGAWLKKTMDERPQDTFSLSNHDVSYRFSLQPKYHGWGFTPDKCRAFHSEFPLSYWKRFVIAHEETWNGQTLLFSHSGFLPNFFPNGIYSHEHVQRVSKIAFANGSAEAYNPWLDSHEGPLWLRWPYLSLLDGVCQIVGHTPVPKPKLRAEYGRREWNLNLDCAHTYYAHFKDKRAFAINRNTGSEHLLRFPDGTEQAPTA